MWCLSEKRSVRVQFINFFRRLMEKARGIRQLWLSGDTTVRYPPGLYPPNMPKLADVVSWQRIVQCLFAGSSPQGRRVATE